MSKADSHVAPAVKSIKLSSEADRNQRYAVWLRRIARDQPEAVLGVLSYWTRDEVGNQRETISL